MEIAPLVICNTTPVINFAEIGRLDVLERLFGEVVLPPAVVDELRHKTNRFPAAAKAWQRSPFRVQEPGHDTAAHSTGAMLHAGEAACLALARSHPGSLLVLDDVAAREAAVASGFHVTGTLGCLIEAGKSGIIPELAPLLTLLQDRARFWISKPLRAFVLQQVGESSPVP